MACPNPEILAAMVESKLGPADRHAVLDHAAGCDDCRHTLLVLGTPQPTAATARLQPTLRSWIPWAAAAVFALAVVGVLLMGKEPQRQRAMTSAAPSISAKEQPRGEPERPTPPQQAAPKSDPSPK